MVCHLESGYTQKRLPSVKKLSEIISGASRVGKPLVSAGLRATGEIPVHSRSFGTF